MFWAILLIGLVVALLMFRSLRKAVLVVVGVIALAFVGLLIYLQHNTGVQKAQDEASKKLVRADQLEFIDMRLGQEYGASYKLTGRVINNSPYTVNVVKAGIQIQDCDEKEQCEVVGDEVHDIVKFGNVIPAGQARDIDESIYFGSGTRVRGHFQWHYVVKEISASSN